MRATELDAGDYKVFSCDDDPDNPDAGTPITVESYIETVAAEKDVAASAIKGRLVGTALSAEKTLANMTVRLPNLATGELRNVKTNAEGRFEFAELDAGDYRTLAAEDGTVSRTSPPPPT